MLSMVKRAARRKYIKILKKIYQWRISTKNIHGFYFSRQNDISSCFTMRNGKKHRLILLNVPKGGYTLTILHSEKVLYDNRKSLVVYLSVPHQAANRKRAQVMGLNYNKRMYFYAGGGRSEKNTYCYKHNIFFTHNTPWIELDFSSPIKKDLDFLRISLVERKITDFPSKLSEVISDKSIKYMLYADIDINICDGSSVWYSSMINILCHIGKVLVICKKDKKSDIILSNVENSNNVSYVFPSTIGLNEDIDIENAITLIRLLDCILPALKQIFVRGINASALLVDDRQFSYRLIPYLTNFYEIKNGKICHSDEQINAVRSIAYHAHTFLVQTREVKNVLENIAASPIKTVSFPPPIPDNLNAIVSRKKDHKSISIGYAGKITPQWGVIQLLRWAEKMNAQGIKIRVTIIANKISASRKIKANFIQILKNYFNKKFVTYIDGLNRSEVMKMLSNMDFVWCYRPKSFEEATLELSTKLVEMVASGAKCLCYPSAINKNLLGDSYPYYVTGYDQFSKILLSDAHYNMSQYKKKLIEEHGFKNLAHKLQSISYTQTSYSKTICFASHDFKFIDPYISMLKAKGYHVLRDVWEWGKAKDQIWHEQCLERSDIIFCEWGLANAVWYSQANILKKPLYIRIHLQEINEKARKFGPQIQVENVSRFIFVSERVRNEALKMWGWPQEKTIVIPNFLLTDEYSLSTERFSSGIHLGMVGIIPSRKRFDRAVDLLQELTKEGMDAYLHIKGHRPEELSFMHAPGRAHELGYYNEVYKKISSDPELSKRIEFEPWGNDVARWYKKIDFILSCSDFESFHYALADGVLSGCYPLIWPWEEAEKIYSSDWVVKDIDMAKNKIKDIYLRRKHFAVANREFLVNRYGKDKIFHNLDSLLLT